MAVNTAMQAMAGIGGGLVRNIATAGGIAVICIGGYFGWNFIQKNLKKQKAFTIEAVIVDMNGVVDFDMLALVKNSESGMLEMELKSRKETLPPLPKHLIKNNKVLLLNYAPGHYCAIDTSDTINNFSHDISKIVPYNLGMKKYLINKQREFLNKAESKKHKWDTYAPWITLSIGIAGAILLAFGLFYVGVKLDNQFVTQRIAECQSAIGAV